MNYYLEASIKRWSRLNYDETNNSSSLRRYRFYCSKFGRMGQWAELSTTLAPEELFVALCDEAFRIYDTDNGGEQKYHFVYVEVGGDGVEKFITVYHEYGIEYEPEWNCYNIFSYEHKNKAPFDYPKRNRDWLKI